MIFRLAGLALAAVLTACWMPSGAGAAPRKSPRANAAASLVTELQRSFTLNGKRIPPEIFRDFGDGNLADSQSIWVTVDLEAAVGSNLYADDIKEQNGWVIQTRPARDASAGEETAYRFVGSTESGLLVVVASYNGGGSGTFHTLHILEVAPARAFGLDGKVYRRTNLTAIRSIVLGDRWDGDVSVSRNAITVTTTRDGPTGVGPARTVTIEARRP